MNEETKLGINCTVENYKFIWMAGGINDFVLFFLLGCHRHRVSPTISIPMSVYLFLSHTTLDISHHKIVMRNVVQSCILYAWAVISVFVIVFHSFSRGSWIIELVLGEIWTATGTYVIYVCTGNWQIPTAIMIESFWFLNKRAPHICNGHEWSRVHKNSHTHPRMNMKLISSLCSMHFDAFVSVCTYTLAHNIHHQKFIVCNNIKWRYCHKNVLLI